MARILSFIFKESFSETTSNRLPERLKISGRNDPEILLIVRLLSGALDLEHKYSGDLIKQRENFFSSDMKGYSQHWAKKLPNLISENYKSNNLAEYVEFTRLKNKKFYKNILLEFCNFFLYTKRGAHTSAFIYLYRTLENISYSFPLIYVSKTDDFLKTFNFLKDLMRENKESGELGFFKSFIKTLYKDEAIGESSVDFNISVTDSDIQERFFLLLKGLCTANMISEATEPPRVLSISYTEVGSFIITIRNRFFHYMNGGAKNIDSEEVVDSDLLFSLINKQCMYWLATVFLGVLSHNINEFEKINTVSHNS